MVNHGLFQRILILSFLFILFFTDVGYTATNTDPLSSTDGAAQQSTASSAGTPADASTDQAAAPVIAAVETSTGDNSFPSLSFTSVAAEPNTGAATASFPIEVPPGRKGLQPSLTLQYNSNGENSWVGVGWDVPGSFIKRNTKYGANYSANDYVHDSAELVARPDWGGNCFGRKIEGVFSKYYFNPATGGWEVTSKDGTKYYYGTTAASRQDNAYGVFKWMLDTVQDTNGNYMTISYWKDQGEIYLDRIDYAGSGNLSPTNYVKFYCETRTDVPTLYTSNVAVKTAYRLKTVDVIANGSRARAYKLSYTTSGSTWQSILVSMQQYGTDATLDAGGTVTGGSSLPAVGLGYSSMSPSISWGLWSNPVFGDVMSKIRVGDFNGDGKNDLYFFANSTNIVGISTGTSFLWYDWGYNGFGDIGSRIVVGDFNGDGKSDLYFRTGDNNDWVGLSNGTTIIWSVWSSPMFGDVMSKIRVGDFNGDGKSDLYFFANNTNWVGLSTGTSFLWQSWEISGFGDIGSRICVGDFNGDGKSDLYFRTGDNNDWVGLSNGTTIIWSVWSSPMFGDVMSKIRVGDFNGDGKSDLYFFASNTNWVGLSTGTSFLWQSWEISGFGDIGSQIRIGDFNGDGKNDLYFFASNTNWVGVSTGTTFIWQQWGSSGFGDVGSRIRVGDFNGDGKSDLYFRTGDNNDWVGLADPSAISQVPDRLNTVSNGLGGVTTIQYKPSSSYTNTLLPFITQTVSTITVNDGNGNVSTTNYTYSGGLYDIPDREFRGFQYVKATDPAGTTSENKFHQDDVLKGLPYELVTKDSAGNIYNWTDNTLQSISPYTGVNFPFLLQKDEYLYDGTTTWKQTSTSFTYDAYGNITRKYFYGDMAVSGDEMDENTEYTYDTTNWILSLPTYTYVRDSNSVNQAKTWFTYDISGNLLTVKKWLQGGTNPITTYTYYNNGNLKSITDPMGNPPTTITYDSTKTYPNQTTNPLGQITTTVYDQKFGKITSKTDVYGNTTTYEYDVFGRPSKVTNPYDGSSSYGTISYWYPDFGIVGNQKMVTYHTEQSGTANYRWEEAYFDGVGRTIKTRREGPDGKVIVGQTTYNQRGLAVTKYLPYFEGIETPRYVTFEYDPVGRITRATNPDNTFTKTIYRKERTTFIDANDHKKLEEKDAYGRLVNVEEYTGAGGNYTLYAVTTYQYNVLGNLLKTIDALNNQTTMVYDTLGRKTSMAEPNMGTWTYSYWANGNLKTQTDAKGQTIQFFYDGLNRMTLKDYPTGTDVTFTYDESSSPGTLSRVTTMTDASGVTKSYYDKLGSITKVIQTVDSVTYTTETTYDALGRTTSIKYPDNEIVAYTYDTGGNLSQVTGYATYTNYNALGQAQSVSYGNGVTTTYQYYSTNNRLSSLNTNGPTQGLINLTYSYDNAGNVTGITDFVNNNRTRTFVYDHLNRLTQASSAVSGTLAYTYNQIGNILSKEGISYAYSTKPHAVSSTSDGKTYTYDANGNMINDTQRAILYNYDNMPAYVNYNGTTTQLVYDGQGNRVKKIAGTTNTVYIGTFYEVVNSGASCYKYIFAGGTRIARKNASATHYYHQDHLGSSSVVTNSSGNNVEEVHYLPFGSAWSDTNTALTTHKFTGQELDAETGLYYYGARYYNPILGRFLSADSIVPDPANPQALNRYSYVINNPLRYTDPTGHFFGNVIIGAVVGAIIGGTTAAVTGGNIKQGIITGAITGAFMGVGGGIIAESGSVLSSMAQAGIYTAAGTMAGATNASIYDSNIGQGALFGGAFGLAGYCVPAPNFRPFGGSSYASIANRVFNAGLTGAAFGAAYTGMTGGDVGQGAMMGALAWAAGEGVNMGIGHGIGYAMSGKAPSFSNGAFYYYSEGQTPFTVGGAIIGDRQKIERFNVVNNEWDYNHTTDQHERSHFPQQTALSVSYIPTHLISQGVGGIVGIFTGVGFGAGTHRYNIFERGWIDVPSY